MGPEKVPRTIFTQNPGFLAQNFWEPSKCNRFEPPGARIVAVIHEKHAKKRDFLHFVGKFWVKNVFFSTQRPGNMRFL